MKMIIFDIKNRHYYWMTMEEILAYSNIREKNLEVVYFVKEFIS